MASSSSNNMPPPLKCRCGATMVMKTAKTELNPNRDFWKCFNVKDGKVCNGFIWDDEVTGKARVREHKPASSVYSLDEGREATRVDDDCYLARIAEKMDKLDKLDKLDNLEKLDKFDKLDFICYEMSSSRRDRQGQPNCCSIL